VLAKHWPTVPICNDIHELKGTEYGTVELITGGYPCQPFSTAGKRGGTSDERHLWPAWFWLIRQCRPSVLLGEQVSSKAGRAWFGVVSSDLEAHGYAVGAADLCAASVGAPHVRQRLWFVAHTNGDERSTNGGESNARTNGGNDTTRGGNSRILANAEDRRQAGIQGGDCKIGSSQAYRNSRQSGHWSDCDWLPCRDGKARPAESGIAPLAHGVPARVGRLRGYGNAIVPQVAAEFVKAYLDCGK